MDQDGAFVSSLLDAIRNLRKTPQNGRALVTEWVKIILVFFLACLLPLVALHRTNLAQLTSNLCLITSILFQRNQMLRSPSGANCPQWTMLSRAQTCWAFLPILLIGWRVWDLFWGIHCVFFMHKEWHATAWTTNCKNGIETMQKKCNQS